MEITKIIKYSACLSLFSVLIACNSCSNNDQDILKKNEKGSGEIVSGMVEKLTDHDPKTYTEVEGNKVTYIIENSLPNVVAYSLTSATGHDASMDPSEWIMYGSNDKTTWSILDKKENVDFWSRYQRRDFSLDEISNYKYFKLSIANPKATKLRLSDVDFYTKYTNEGWENFRYPIVKFNLKDKNHEGARYYSYLVQNIDQYIKYHAREVAKILYYKNSTEIENVQIINYNLHDFDGISYKSGSIPSLAIDYSLSYIVKSYFKSLSYLTYETRGVLYHEMTHCYQHEPKNCGAYDGKSPFWVFLEGVADAVRIHADFIPMTNRKIGGHYNDGYQTTGFFLDWLTTKDKNAIRKFNESALHLDPWSFGGAIKYVFGENASVDELWEEYQTFLRTN